MRLASLLTVVFLGMSCTETVIEPASPPPRPTDLRATMLSPKSVRLSWNGANELAYSVFRNDLKLGDAESTQFIDSTVADNTTYTWFVVANSTDGRVSRPSEPVTLGFGDISGPTVSASSVTNGATNVSRLPNLVLTFNEEMIPLSVISGGIVARVPATGETVYGSVNYDLATRTADFSPLSLLPARSTVTISVTPEAKDLAGNRAASFSLSFTTGDSPAALTDLAPNEHVLLVSAGFTGTNSSRDLFKMRADGTGRINITNSRGNDFSGSWSPDGRHVVFSSDRNGTFDIYLMREDGSALRQLTFDAKDQGQPRWSHDGRRIVFASTRDGVPPLESGSTPGDIWVMNPDGSSQSPLTETPQVYESWPHLSPDGSRVLYRRDSLRATDNGFWIANADGTEQRQLRPRSSEFSDDRAAWSPDGSKIAFSAYDFAASNQFHDQYDLYVMNADGSNLRRVTRFGSPRYPAWSPDGRSLLFSTSGNDEFWARFGLIGAAIVEIETGAITVVAPQSSASEVMSPQSWRR